MLTSASASVAASFSFSSRTSRPRLWQYQKTKRRTCFFFFLGVFWFGGKKGEGREGLTEEGEGVEDVHAEEGGEAEFEEIHDGF